jgi:tRNA 2-thiouridine synthesizing protein E
VDVARVRPAAFRVARHQHQRFVEQRLHDQPRARGRRVHDADVDRALDQALHDVGLEADLQPQRHIGRRVAHPCDPVRQEALPQRDASRQRQHVAEALRQTDVVHGLFDRAHQMLGMAHETPAGGGEFRTVAATLEQARAERRFETLDARTDGRLRDVQAGRGGNEIAGGGDGEKGTGEFGIHDFLSMFPISNTNNHRWSNELKRHKLASYRKPCRRCDMNAVYENDAIMTLPERDVEGYLVDPADWNEDIAEMLAEEEGVALTDEHWDVIRFMRDYFDKHGIAADARFVNKHLSGRMNLGAQTKLFELFPYGYVKQACKIAGMRRPRAWSTG